MEKERQKFRHTGRRQERREVLLTGRTMKGGSERRCDRREVGHKDDYSKNIVKRKMKERNKREGSSAGNSTAR